MAGSKNADFRSELGKYALPYSSILRASDQPDSKRSVGFEFSSCRISERN